MPKPSASRGAGLLTHRGRRTTGGNRVITRQPGKTSSSIAAGGVDGANRPWREPLCHWCSNHETLVIGLFSPCIISKKVEEDLQESDPSLRRTCGVCCLWMLSAVDSPITALLLSAVFPGLFGPVYSYTSVQSLCTAAAPVLSPLSLVDCFLLCGQRKRFRRKYGIAPDTTFLDDMDDVVCVVCCKCCVRIQMANELHYIEKSKLKRTV